MTMTIEKWNMEMGEREREKSYGNATTADEMYFPMLVGDDRISVGAFCVGALVCGWASERRSVSIRFMMRTAHCKLHLPKCENLHFAKSLASVGCKLACRCQNICYRNCHWCSLLDIHPSLCQHDMWEWMGKSSIYQCSIYVLYCWCACTYDAGVIWRATEIKNQSEHFYLRTLRYTLETINRNIIRRQALRFR